MSHKDPEKRKAYKAAWYAANKERLEASRDHERTRARMRAWREANRERLTAEDRAYREAKREQIAVTKAAYRRANRERLSEYQRVGSVRLGGEQVWINTLPEELRPIALAIQEARREIKRSSQK